MMQSRLLRLYVGVVCAIGLSIFATNIMHVFRHPEYRVGEYFILALGVIGGEFVRIRIPHRKETLTVTVGDPFTLSLLFAFGLGPALAAKVVATVLDDIYRRSVWWKSLFNVSQFSIALGAGYLVIMSLGFRPDPDSPLETPGILAFLLAAAAYFVVNMTTVTTAIALAVQESPMVAIKANLMMRVINQGALLGFTPVVNAALQESLFLFPLILIPIIVVYQSGSLTQRHIQMAEQLTDLYETTRITSARVDTRDSVRELLERVCNMFNAAGASIVFFARDGEETPHETSLDLDKSAFRYMEPTTLDPTKGLWARAAAEDKALMLASPIGNATLRSHYEVEGIKDIMVAPMHADDEVNGIIRVFNRQGQSQTFGGDDLQLFETLANHASIAMENARLINQLEESLAHLTEMNRLKDDFVASVSHELRTPLTSIQGYVKTLLRTDASFSEVDRRSFLETVDRQSARLHRLIEDLLAVSRIESKTDSTHYSIISLEQVAQEVIGEVHNRVSAGQIQLDFDGALPVETDGGKVHQILANLVDNGLKYGGKDNPVVIRGRRDGEGASISVIDQGEGVPGELQERVFDRFYQVDQSATRSVGGAGLGLYICRRMAEAIGGRIWLERTGAEGSTFTLWIPSAPTPIGDTAALTKASSKGPWKL